MFADEWIFPDKENSQLESSSLLRIASETSHDVSGSAPSDDQTYKSKEAAEVPEDVFTYSSKPRSAPHGKPLSLSSEDCTFSLDLKEEISKDWRGAQMEDDFYGNESNGEECHQGWDSTSSVRLYRTGSSEEQFCVCCCFGPPPPTRALTTAAVEKAGKKCLFKRCTPMHSAAQLSG
uniref:Uncharacterized protein n=1 Tax=Laticauda laticaudata TaxID=8630 RepID=A0A8C5SFK2_LATLA